MGINLRQNTKRFKEPKIRMEFNDTTGAKYSFSVEGLSKENMIKLMDFIQLVSPNNLNDQRIIEKNDPREGSSDTNFARIYLLLETKFRFGSFTSTDVLEACQDELGLQLTLPTISTYLSRLAERDLLVRHRNGAGWIYRLAKPSSELETEQSMNSSSTPPTPTDSTTTFPS